MSAAGAQLVADSGVGLLLARSALKEGQATDELQLPLVNAYLAAWNGHGAPRRIGISRSVYPATDKRTALAQMRTDIVRTVEDLVAQGQLPPGLTLEQYCRCLHIAYGHPDEVAMTLLSDRVLPYATDLIIQFSPALPPLATALRMLEQMAKEIAPELGWQPQELQDGDKHA